MNLESLRRRAAVRRRLGLVLTACGWLPGLLIGATLDTYTVVLDGAGKIIPWTTNAAAGYDRVMFLSWDLLKNRIPNDPANGLPVTYTHSEYNPDNRTGTTWPNNPAGKHAMLADAAVMYYAYSGDIAVVNLVRGLLDHQLARGTTPTNYAWARVPWSTAAAGSTNFGNDSAREGVGVLEPDKVGELGYHGYLRFYQLTGDADYLDAALACADALAQRVRAGNATQSPWPFRVNAQTGATAQQEEYCADVIAPIRLFDELIRLGLGDTNAYQTARQQAWTWLMTYPMTNNVWANYFEDVGPMPNVLTNLNQYNPGQTARYLLEYPERDPDWYAHVTNLLGFIETRFGGTDMGEAGMQFGARVISEQERYKYKMASHTARFAANNAMLFALTGDLNAKEKAYRSLNWSTYMCRSNGVVIEGPAEFAQNMPCWFTDGHGDYVRHFMLALGAVPEWSPAGQNHIVRSTSVIKSVTYATNSVVYTTFDGDSTETLRLGFVPGSVLVDGVALSPREDLNQPGWVYDADTDVLRIRHAVGTQVQISTTPMLAVVTSNLSPAKVGLTYTKQLVASGGFPPLSWDVATNSAVPAGLKLSKNGVLTGQPTEAGDFTIAVEVSDTANTTASRELDLPVDHLIVTLGIPSQSGEQIRNEGFKLTITANEPGNYLLQRTGDLTNWQGFEQVVYTNNPVPVTDPNSTGASRFLYRAVRQSN